MGKQAWLPLDPPQCLQGAIFWPMDYKAVLWQGEVIPEWLWVSLRSPDSAACLLQSQTPASQIGQGREGGGVRG